MNERNIGIKGSPFSVPRWAFAAAAVPLIGLAAAALAGYPGQAWVYVLFTFAANALLFFGFRPGAIFFDSFIGLLFWLGFWLKFSVRMAFMGGQFHESVGTFNGSGAAFDQALLVCICAFAALLMASIIRERWMFSYRNQPRAGPHDACLAFYTNFRFAILAAFVAVVLLVGGSNLILGIYQRGAIPRTVLPFGLGGVYTWLLLFGLSSASSLLLHLEMRRTGRISVILAGLAIFECFITNVSLLSRGMILNATSILLGLYGAARQVGIVQRFWTWAAIGTIFATAFIASVLGVNHLRSGQYTGSVSAGGLAGIPVNAHVIKSSTMALFLDRWVGMEGVLAVVGSPLRSWSFWDQAWKETYQKKLSFYDANLITSAYVNTDLTKVHHVSLPGIVAFFYYPGSMPFLFGSLLLLGLLAACFEWLAFKLGGGNLILCALCAQVIAARFAHFGYLPKQTYLLFGTILLNLLLIYFANWLLVRWYSRKKVDVSTR